MSDERLDAIPTQWSLVRQAHALGTPAHAAEARRLLVLRYAPAMRRYLGRLTRDQDVADDLAQDALLRLMRGDFAGADPNRGRFRDLLKAAVRNLARNQWAKDARRRPVEFDIALLTSDDDAERAWLAEWRKTVLDNAWSAMKTAEESSQAGHPHAILRLRADYPEDSSEQLAERLAAKLGIPVRADAARQMLRRARRRFAVAVLAEVQAGLADASPERLEEELAALEFLEYLRDSLPEGKGT
jgi:DNA-directed RNA polymerase specialized sigma24 family protein